MILSPSKRAESFGIDPKKSLGQNFLFDLNITRKIVASCGDISGLNIIEIGPGPGGLTQVILEQDIRKLYSIEFDKRAVTALHDLETVYGEKFQIIEADALKYSIEQISEPKAVIANLPYNIGTKLITNWLDERGYFKFICVMLQKEVAERITASTRTKDYGRLSVIVQWQCETEILFHVPPSAFFPPPKVTSTVIKLTPRKQPLFPANKKRLEDVLRAAFGQRRKMIKSALKSVLPDTENALKNIGINPQARAEELSIEEFCKIANI